MKHRYIRRHVKITPEELRCVVEAGFENGLKRVVTSAVAEELSYWKSKAEALESDLRSHVGRNLAEILEKEISKIKKRKK